LGQPGLEPEGLEFGTDRHLQSMRAV
jgi:hypothetical protein